QLVSRLMRQTIRSALNIEISIFHRTIHEVLRYGRLIYEYSQRVPYPVTVKGINGSEVVKSLGQFLGATDTILQYLDFHEKKTGMPSAGDPQLRQMVEGGRYLIETFMVAYVYHGDCVDRPGFHLGLIYHRDIKNLNGSVMIRNQNRQPWALHVSDLELSQLHLDTMLDYWHYPKLHHPVIVVPGTPWHKFMGNLKCGPNHVPLIFDGKPRFNLELWTPEVGIYMELEIIKTYDELQKKFE
ncbi:hypothetical protein B0T25DRAFT_430313, partial [Lasiosphaeria hispida]